MKSLSFMIEELSLFTDRFRVSDDPEEKDFVFTLLECTTKPSNSFYKQLDYTISVLEAFIDGYISSSQATLLLSRNAFSSTLEYIQTKRALIYLMKIHNKDSF